MSVTDRAADPEDALRSRFGLESFRPGQREVIENVLRGRDVLCVMPTGGGKSLCYQLPALLLNGPTLVVSPLIALMKDQVDALVERGVKATLINSTLDPSEQRARMLEIEAGVYDLVYVAPERFRSGRFVEMMARVKPALLAVDEAHCISQWGHDFRPDYSRIGLARKKLGSPPCIALTATATDVVRRDIADQLDLNDPALFVTGFDRPNLSYAVVEARKDADKLAGLARVLDQSRGSAIVYASSRAKCSTVADFLNKELRREAVVYHAGLTREERTSAQERFMSGEAEVVVATNAFGMGVDKPDIRAVVHFNLPGTLEAYYQEAGRAGRDGIPARCVLLYASNDRILQEMFIENEYPPPEFVFRVYDTLRKLDVDPIELTQAEIKAEAGVDLNESAVGTALKLLEGAGAIERFLPRENMAIVRINAGADDDPGSESLVDRLGPTAHVQRVVLLGLEGLVNRRYAEPIYFQPDEFAATLGLDRPALTRALKAITSELPVDYVPPFRGNAIRVTDRGRRARDIEIDFAALRQRKSREYDKLERMIQYAQGKRCRRAFLLGYFGDAAAEDTRCGGCDNCGDVGGGPPAGRPTSVGLEGKAARDVVLKVLSGVARAKGRFGKNVIAQMLKGSASEKMDRWGLRNLSTFGILSHFTQPELTGLLDALADAGYVEYPEVDRFRPVVNLTEAGWSLLKNPGDGPIQLTLSDELAGKIRQGGLERLAARPASPNAVTSPGEAESSSFAGDPLFERLRTMRTEWAREAKQPAYCIFTNATLEALVHSRPTTPAALAAVKGFGAARLERYGAAVLEAITASPAAGVAREPATAPAVRASGKTLPLTRGELEGVPSEPRPIAGAPPTPGGGREGTSDARRDVGPAAPHVAAPAPRSRALPTEEWTWRLLEKGFSPEDVAEIRTLDRAAVVRHATLCVRQGKAVRLESFLDAETLGRWDRWLAEWGDAAPPDGPNASSDLWALFVACRRL